MNNQFILISYIINGDEKSDEIPYNYVFDRIDSIKSRISYHIDTLPYLTLVHTWQPDNLIIYNRIDSHTHEYEFNIESFKLEVESSEISNFIEWADRLMKKYNIKTKKEYTLYWIYYNSNFRNSKGNLYKTIDKLKESKTGIYETVITSFYDFYGESEKEQYSEFENI